jgi:hypothetical protein
LRKIFVVVVVEQVDVADPAVVGVLRRRRRRLVDVVVLGPI